MDIEKVAQDFVTEHTRLPTGLELDGLLRNAPEGAKRAIRLHLQRICEKRLKESSDQQS